MNSNNKISLDVKCHNQILYNKYNNDLKEWYLNNKNIIHNLFQSLLNISEKYNININKNNKVFNEFVQLLFQNKFNVI